MHFKKLFVLVALFLSSNVSSNGGPLTVGPVNTIDTVALQEIQKEEQRIKNVQTFFYTSLSCATGCKVAECILQGALYEYMKVYGARSTFIANNSFIVNLARINMICRIARYLLLGTNACYFVKKTNAKIISKTIVHTKTASAILNGTLGGFIGGAILTALAFIF